MTNFWDELPNKFTILAPMEDVTDTVFRQIVIDAGRPDVFFTEFTNVDGLLSKGVEKVAQRLRFEKNELPLVAQIWGNDPDKFFKVGQLLLDLGFSGIDINMGCPKDDVVKKFCGGGVIRDPKLASEIIDATKRGANGLPVSVKTRIGYKKIETESWIPHLLSQNLPNLSVHLRTVAEMSKVPAHFEELEKIVSLKNEISPKTKITANGDIKNMNQADHLFETYKIDGVMIGRGIFENIWIFNRNINPFEMSLKIRFSMMKKHVELYEKEWGEKKNFNALKKYFKIYTFGLPNASELRVKLMETTNYSEAKKLIDSLLKTHLIN